MNKVDLDYDDEIGADAASLGIDNLRRLAHVELSVSAPLTVSAPTPPIPRTDKEAIALAITTLEECGLTEPIFNEWCEEYLAGVGHSLELRDVRKSLEDHKRQCRDFYKNRYDGESLRSNYGLRTALCVLRYLEIKHELWLDKALFYARAALEIIS